MPEYVLMSLNMPSHGWILLNVPEYAWINCSDHGDVMLNYYISMVWLCQGSQYASSSSIFDRVLNIIILICSICTSKCSITKDFIFFKTSLEHKNNKSFNKLFFLTTMTSELSKYLNEQLGVFLNVKQQNWSQLKT